MTELGNGICYCEKWLSLFKDLTGRRHNLGLEARYPSDSCSVTCFMFALRMLHVAMPCVPVRILCVFISSYSWCKLRVIPPSDVSDHCPILEEVSVLGQVGLRSVVSRHFRLPPFCFPVLPQVVWVVQRPGVLDIHIADMWGGARVLQWNLLVSLHAYLCQNLCINLVVFWREKKCRQMPIQQLSSSMRRVCNDNCQFVKRSKHPIDSHARDIHWDSLFTKWCQQRETDRHTEREIYHTRNARQHHNYRWQLQLPSSEQKIVFNVFLPSC